ncbi:hypothetical protein ACFFX1_55510 [Dactylosporangium sucinum]|uniref:Uncharacterized protein n=1 Tax=Dactylosporangium sucinum TaxID=1424081 RepID=A0A917X1E0_9ACTN|nr:hypothetical protein [Dactylosporangium sucinum]GGM52560.1 hypothetical protein GCM10007977_062620 [Dactylosporangium sucinum]
MITPLEPTPELLAAARRIAAREWKLGPGDSYDAGVDAHLLLLSLHRLACLHFATPEALLAGGSDRWTLTTKGREWLAEHDPETKETTA